MKKMNNFCPVCGYDLGFMAWDGDSPSFEICPSCGIQYGYMDMTYDLNKKKEIYEEWRKKWVSEGMKWSSANNPLQQEPKSWDPKKQLKNIPF